MKDLETKYALLLCENEDLEVKCNQLENDKIVLEDTLEEAYGEARDLRKVAEHLKLKSKFENNEKVIERHLTTIKELTENVMILENKVESRNSEVVKLKEELESNERVNMPEKLNLAIRINLKKISKRMKIYPLHLDAENVTMKVKKNVK